MFDLIDECGKDLKKYGYNVKMLGRHGISFAYLEVKNEKESKEIGLAKGDYYIFNSPFIYQLGQENEDYLISLLVQKLKDVLKKLKITSKSKILVVGLGNPDIASDRLGKEVFDNITIDALAEDNRIFKFCPNIFFSTGIDTQRMIKMFSSELDVDLVVLIDSLSTSSLSRLGTSFQITTSGMTPGSGVNRFGNRISKESMGKECISIGVPFMINSNALNSDEEFEVILAPKDVRENVEIAGHIIAQALNEVIK